MTLTTAPASTTYLMMKNFTAHAETNQTIKRVTSAKNTGSEKPLSSASELKSRTRTQLFNQPNPWFRKLHNSQLSNL